MTSKIAIRCLSLVSLFVAFGAPTFANTTYKLTLLRPLAGNTTSQATSGINEHGTTVGTSGGQGMRRATIWSPQGSPMELARPTRSIFSRAMAINERGTVVGAVDTTGAADLTGLRAVRWSSLKRFTFILPESGFDSDALSINDAGWITGILFTGTTFTAFIANTQGRVDYPAPLLNGDDFELLGINRRGEAAGFDASDAATTAGRRREDSMR